MIGSAEQFGKRAGGYLAGCLTDSPVLLVDDLTGNRIAGSEFAATASSHISARLRFRDAVSTYVDLAKTHAARIIAFAPNKEATAAIANCFREALPKGAVLQCYNPTTVYEAIRSLQTSPSPG